MGMSNVNECFVSIPISPSIEMNLVISIFVFGCT